MTTDAGAGGPGSRPEPRTRTMPGQRLVNLLVRGLLRTPGLSRIIGTRLVILYVVGRKSRRRYSVPVAYVAEGDDLLIGTSFGWGRNLRTGERVAIRLRGRLRWADVRACTEESEVVSAYARMARANPTFARFNSVRVGEDGEPDRDDLRSVWQSGGRALRLTPR
jgi:deazaflavin-dependent oxidoreductase (nitroreductase family)